MGLFGHNKTQKLLGNFDVAFRFHDPESRALIIYNHGHSRKCKVEVVVRTSNKQVFSHLIEEILSRTGVELAFDSLHSTDGNAFAGNIQEVVIKYAGAERVFVLKENKFTK